MDTEGTHRYHATRTWARRVQYVVIKDYVPITGIRESLVLLERCCCSMYLLYHVIVLPCYYDREGGWAQNRGR